MSRTLKLKDILLTIPSEIEDIYEICLNEIKLSNNDLNVLFYYSRIYYDSLLITYNLIPDNMDSIKIFMDNIMKSIDQSEVKQQYRRITNPKNIIPALLLKNLNNLTNFNSVTFTDDKMKKYYVSDVLLRLIVSKLDNTKPYSDSFTKKILNSEFEVN